MNNMNKQPNYIKFLDTIFNHLKKQDIDVNGMALDHIAHRTETDQEYLEIKKHYAKIGELTSENKIRGRPIAVFKLFDPIRYKGKEIYYIEIMAPALDNKYKSGLQHVEFVVEMRLMSLVEKYPDVVFHLSKLSRKINPELELKFDDGLAVKFHNLPIWEAAKKQQEYGEL